MRILGAVVGLLLTVGALAAPSGVRFEQRIGQRLPLDLVFRDEGGHMMPLRTLFGKKPVVLSFSYFRCPELCSLVGQGTVDVLRALEASVGRDYTVISISIDPGDTPEMARSQQERQVLRYGRRGSSVGWHILVGDQPAISALTDAAGFHFAYDPRSRQYAHPSGILLVTPDGVISSYFLGIDFSAPQFSAALRRAAENRTGSSAFSLLFVCFEGGSPQGRYGRLIWAALSISVALTVVGVFGGIGWMLRSERRTKAGMGGAS